MESSITMPIDLTTEQPATDTSTSIIGVNTSIVILIWFEIIAACLV